MSKAWARAAALVRRSETWAVRIVYSRMASSAKLPDGTELNGTSRTFRAVVIVRWL